MKKTKYLYIAILLIVIIITPLYIRLFSSTRKETFATLKTVIEQNDFDRYVINMEKNKDRLEEITNRYNQTDLAEIPFIRFEAVNGKDIDVKPFVTESVYNGIMQLDKTHERRTYKQLTRGMIGCYLSHLEIYKKIQQSTKPYALILEDDAFFTENNIYTSAIRNAFEYIPPDWDIIMLGRMTFDPSHVVVDHETYLELRKFWGTYGYLISKAGVNKMLQYGALPIDDQIDAIMCKLQNDQILNIYAPKTEYIKMNSKFGSDVQQEILEDK